MKKNLAQQNMGSLYDIEKLLKVFQFTKFSSYLFFRIFWSSVYRPRNRGLCPHCTRGCTSKLVQLHCTSNDLSQQVGTWFILSPKSQASSSLWVTQTPIKHLPRTSWASPEYLPSSKHILYAPGPFWAFHSVSRVPLLSNSKSSPKPLQIISRATQKHLRNSMLF